jgi:ribonuclease Z
MVMHNSRLFLLDAGEGTQFQLQRYKIRIRNLDAVFISHLHGDHVFGLPGLLTSMSIYGRTDALTVVGPPGIRQYIEFQFKLSDTQLRFALHFTELPLPPRGQLAPAFENRWLSVSCFGLKHRIDCLGYRFDEKPKLPRLDAEKAGALGIPKEYYHLLKQGNTITLADGSVVHPHQVLGQPEPPYSYAYCTDTRYLPEVVTAVQGSSVLYHEATFLHQMLKRAEETGHSTAHQAGQLAQAAGVGHLLIGHFSARYPGLQPLLDEARAVFPHTSLAQEGRVFDIPYQATEHPTPVADFNLPPNLV